MKLHLGPKQYDLSPLRFVAMLCLALICLVSPKSAISQNLAGYTNPPLIGIETPQEIQADRTAMLRHSLQPEAADFLPTFSNPDLKANGLRVADDAPVPATASQVTSTEQTVDLTLSTIPAASLSTTTGIPIAPTPYYTDVTWSHNEQFLIFSAIAPGTNNYHLWLTLASGAPITYSSNGTPIYIEQLTFGNNDERYPSLLGPDDSQIAYCTDADSANAYELVTAPFNSVGGFSVNQTDATFLDINLEARHPFYGGDTIYFSGRPVGGTAPFDIYSVTVSNGSTTVLQFTGGGVADNDNPTVSNSGIIAWDSNAAGFAYNPQVPAGQAPLTTTTLSAGNQRNIFVADLSGEGVEAVTIGSSTYSNEHPTWTTGTTNSFTVSGYYDLFFDSNRPAQYGQPANSSTYHIYYFGALTPTAVVPESSVTPAPLPALTELNTSDPSGYAAGVPAGGVSNGYNDIQPAVSSLIAPYISVAYISNRYLITHNYDNPLLQSSLHNPVTVATANSQVTLGISTSLSQAVVAGATVLPVTNVVGTGSTPVFFPGQTLYIDQGTDTFESVTITAVNNSASPTLTVTPLQDDHLVGADAIVASTTLTGPTAAGATVIPVTSVNGFVVGQTIELDRGTPGVDEFVIITAITAGGSPSLTVTPLAFNHTSGSSVYPTVDQEPTSVPVIPTAQAKIASEIFVSRLQDVNPPSLVRYNEGDDEIVHVISGGLYNSDGSTNYNPAATVNHYVPAGKQATFVVRISDRQTGTGQLFLQIKDPNSFSQNSTGLEHKVFGQQLSSQFHPVENEATLFGAGAIGGNGIEVGNQVVVLQNNTTLTLPSAGAGNPVVASTELASPVAAKATVLPIYNSNGFAPGETILIDPGTANQEQVTVVAVNQTQPPTLTVTQTAFAHAIQAVVEYLNPNFGNTGTVLTVASTAGFAVGDEIDLGYGTGTPELVFITAINPGNGNATPGTITVGATQFPHAAGAQLVVATLETTLNNQGGPYVLPVANPGGLVIGDIVIVGSASTVAEVVALSATSVTVDEAIAQQPSTLQYAIGVGIWPSTTPIIRIGNANFDPMGNEIDCQAVDTNYLANVNGVDRLSADPTKYHIPDFLPGESDGGSFDNAMNGSASGGVPGYWLKMQPLPANLQDQNGGVLYYATWITPETGSDYNIDVIAEDNSVRMTTAGGGIDQQGENWRIYDNVWGFYTLPFQQKNKILVVNDYALPQRFFSRAGANGPGNEFGTESYWTDINNNVIAWETYFYQTPSVQLTQAEAGLAPTVVLPLIGTNSAARAKLSYGSADTADNTFPPYQNSLGVNSYWDSEMGQTTVVGSGVNSTNLPASQQYDVWRILTRGPVPQSILNSYGSTTITTPPNPATTSNTPITTISAPDCVVWLSPYSGDAFVGSGTITDPNTQLTLEEFIAAGGRLHIEGKDIGYALTNNGGSLNSFYDTYLNDNYKTQAFITDDVGFGQNAYVLTAAGGNTDLISHDAFFNTNHINYLYPDGNNNAQYNPPSNTGFGSQIIVGNYGDYGTPADARTDASMDCSTDNSSFMDGFNTNAATELNGTTNREAFYENATTGAIVSYSSFGMSTISQNVQSYGGAPIPAYVVDNQRSHLVHNIVCTLRTGSISGVITAISTTQPIPGVVVSATGNGTTVYTALTDATGTYHLLGLIAGAYQINAYKQGYVTQHTSGSGQIVHGGDVARLNLSLLAAANGSLTVTVVDSNNNPIFGASVSLTSTDGGVSPNPGTTDVTGVALFSNVPADTYSLVVSASGYMTSTTQQIISSGVSSAVTITLSALPTTISGTVFVAGSSPQVPIAGATLTLTNSAGVAIVPTTGTGPITTTSAADGTFTFTVAGGTLPSGTAVYVDGAAVGYSPSNPPVGIITGNVTLSTLTYSGLLIPLSPVSTLSVTVVDALTHAGVAGISITATAATATLGPLTTDANGNVQFEPVAAGSYTVTAQPNSYLAEGYVSATYSPTNPVTVSGTTTTAVTVTLQPSLGILQGTVTSALTGAPIYPATVTVYNSNNAVVATLGTTPQGFYTTSPSIRSGTYTAIATATNYITSAAVTVTISNGVTVTQNFALGLTTIHQYPAGLQMISAPYDYTGQSLSSVLIGDYDSTDNEPNVIASWNPLTGSYIKTPNSPDETLHAGQGYWARFPTTGGYLVTAGTTVTSWQIVLQPGWNMIGDPFNAPIALGNLGFYDSRGDGDPSNSNNPYSFAQASGAGGLNLVSPYLYTYSQSTNSYTLVSNSASSGATASTLAPYSGYWIQAFTTCTLIF
jgi:hypothetical protein